MVGHRLRFVAFFVGLMVLAGCTPALNACKSSLSSCQGTLNTTMHERDEVRTERDHIKGQFEQYVVDSNLTISDLAQQLNTSKEREEYWRSQAENATITVGILSERTRNLQSTKQVSLWTSSAAFLGELLLGIALYFFGKTADTLDPILAARYKRRRFWVYAALLAVLLFTAGIMSISAN